MIASMLALLAVAPAEAAPITGSWRVVMVDTADGAIQFPDAMAEEGSRLVYGRWLWTFEEGRIQVRSEALRSTNERSSTKGKAEVKNSDLQWCATSISVDVGWQGETLLLPNLVQAESRAGRYDKKAAPLVITECSVRLNAVGPLKLMPAGASAPQGAIRLQSPNTPLAFTLVRDTPSVNVKALLAE